MPFAFRAHACPSQAQEHSVVTLTFFSLLFPASIVTVIRLVNDAVDDIESEGMSAFLFTRLSLLHLPLGAFRGAGRGHNVLKAAEAFFTFILNSINKERVWHKYTIFVLVSQSASAFHCSIWFLLWVFFFVSDYHSLASFVVSNMDKEQRRNSPGE